MADPQLLQNRASSAICDPQLVQKAISDQNITTPKGFGVFSLPFEGSPTSGESTREFSTNA
jgi:hypothetical protein